MLSKVQNKLKRLQNIIKYNHFIKILQEIFGDVFATDDFIKIIQDRLYDTGIDSQGTKLKTDYSEDGFYSPNTIRQKQLDGDKFSNVTLKDSGDFYESMDGITDAKSFKLTADFDKPDGNIYNNFTELYSSPAEFERIILSLTPPEKVQWVRTQLIPEFILYLKRDIRNATK